MKRYLVFLGDTYYPRQGMEDFIGSFDLYSKAKETLTALFTTSDLAEENQTLKWGCVYDSHILRYVYSIDIEAYPMKFTEILGEHDEPA